MERTNPTRTSAGIWHRNGPAPTEPTASPRACRAIRVAADGGCLAQGATPRQPLRVKTRGSVHRSASLRTERQHPCEPGGSAGFQRAICVPGPPQPAGSVWSMRMCTLTTGHRGEQRRRPWPACALARGDVGEQRLAGDIHASPWRPGCRAQTAPPGPRHCRSWPSGRTAPGSRATSSQVSLPTESYTTFTPLPPVMSLTRGQEVLGGGS